MKRQITFNLRNVSRKKFWQAAKNGHTVLRLFKKSTKVNRIYIGYSMPYGGREESNNYNLSKITFETTNQ